MKEIKLAIAGVLGLIALLFVWLSFYTVEQGERAIVLRFGEVTSVEEPGLHFKIPFIDSVREMSVRTQKFQGSQAVYSKDIQAAEVVMSINYSLNPAEVGNIFSKYGMDYEGRIIVPQILSKVKDTFGQYNAVETVQNRDKVATRILTDLQDRMLVIGVLVESVQIENIDFSDEYERNVEERMKAEVEVAKVRQNLEREKINADMARTQAQGQADALLATAEAEAKATKLKGEAEAYSIDLKTKALKANPEYVKLIQAERWNGTLPTTMLPDGTVPIINTK